MQRTKHLSSCHYPPAHCQEWIRHEFLGEDAEEDG